MAREYQAERSRSIEELGLDWDEIRESSLEELARTGAQLVLSAFLRREVEQHLNAERHERTEARKGYRNGGRDRSVRLGSGEIEVRLPKVRDTETPFHSRVLERYQRASAEVTAVLPSLYTEGLSTRDFRRALRPLWKESGLSRSSISRANRELYDEFAAWRKRKLEREQLLYLFLDGYYLGVRRHGSEKEAILVAHGFKQDGSRALLGVYLGGRESTRSWKLVLEDLRARGLPLPNLVVIDGNPGLIAALREADWAEVSRQRCIVHRTRNVLERVPKGRQAEVRKALNRIWYAPSLEEAQAQARKFAQKYGRVFPAAVEILGADLASCLSFFRFPPRHWKRLRTSNPLERAFLEVRRRTNVVGRFPNETSALALIFAVLAQEGEKWRGLRLQDGEALDVEKAGQLLKTHPIQVRGFEDIAA